MDSCIIYTNKDLVEARDRCDLSSISSLLDDYIVTKLLYDTGISIEKVNTPLYSTIREVLFTLECYNFKSNSQILDTLNNVYKIDFNINFIYINKTLTTEQELVGIPKSILDFLCSQDKMLLYSFDYENKIVTFVSDFFSDLSLNTLSKEFIDYTVEHIFVSPYNFEYLKRGKNSIECDYNPLILFHRILISCIEKGGSDLHFEVPYDDVLQRRTYEYGFRINGDFVLQKDFYLTKEVYNKIITDVVEKKTNSPVSELDAIVGVTTSYNDPFSNGDVRLRISGNAVDDFSSDNSYTFVDRIQNYKTTHFTIDTLGLKERETKLLKKFCKLSNGLTLVSGPVRSGKNVTTTSMIREMKKRPIRVQDFSNPIEVLLPCNQIEYRNLEHLLHLTTLVKKQDTDVVHLNEIAFKEVAKAVQDLVDASVGVITTIHANRVWNIVSKLKHYLGNEDYKDIFLQMNGVVNQKMYKKVCHHCSDSVAVNKNNLPEEIVDFCNKYDISSYPESKGCAKCKFTGFIGVQPYAEILDMTYEIKDKILSSDNVYEAEKSIREYMISGKWSLEYAVAKDIKAGVLSLDCLYTLL